MDPVDDTVILPALSNVIIVDFNMSASLLGFVVGVSPKSLSFTLILDVMSPPIPAYTLTEYVPAGTSTWNTSPSASAVYV